MKPKPARSARILVVEHEQTMRETIEKLLIRDGYWVDKADNEFTAIATIVLDRPDLILISLCGSAQELLRKARTIRELGGLTEKTPIIIFSIPTIPEGVEENVGGNIYITAPENFDQLRELIAWTLSQGSPMP